MNKAEKTDKKLLLKQIPAHKGQLQLLVQLFIFAVCTEMLVIHASNRFQEERYIVHD